VLGHFERETIPFALYLERILNSRELILETHVYDRADNLGDDSFIHIN
jgi:hypothetical protein